MSEQRKIDAVLSYHMDPLTCGVAKFNLQLAKRLGVPCWSMRQAEVGHALVSVKPSEFEGLPCGLRRPYDLFLHDWRASWETLTFEARRVFAANGEIAETVRPIRSDVQEAWCPSLLESPVTEPIIVFSFAMAHKLRTDLYAKLKQLLDDTGEPYTVRLSTALHDGRSFSECRRAFEELEQLFGPHFFFVGTFSDRMIATEIRRSHYVAAFFERGLRQNNTTVMTALGLGASVITNWDLHTPPRLMALTHNIGLDRLPHITTRDMVEEQYGWDRLVELIHGA